MDSTPLFILVALLLLVGCTCDSFRSADSNGDGKIDHAEFNTYLTTLKLAMDPFLESSGPVGTVTAFDPAKYVAEFLHCGTEFISGLMNSLVVILVTEIGDKTFFIAAVLAMSNGRLVVYLGAMSALAVMHVLSSLMGFALPNLLPRAYTHFASAILFVYFGLRLLKDAQEMKGEGPSDELQEVEEELINKKEEGDGNDSPNKHDVEEGDEGDGSKKKATSGSSFQPQQIKVFTQAFTLTFLAEWGDRSQIATIALASTKNVWGVILGGLVGHAFCTGLAVVGGRMLAAKISERTVAITGGLLFLAFAVHSFMFGPDAVATP